MKKLLFKCTLMTFIVGTILYLGGAAYRQTNTYRNLERTEETEKFHDMPASIDIAVFGSSHGRDAFKYPPDGEELFNFSMSSQTPQYDLAMLRQFQDRIRPGALVVLTLSYSSPYCTDTEEVFQSKQPRYYRVLSAENIVDVDLGKYYVNQLSPLLALEPSEILSAFFFHPPLNPTEDEQRGHNQFLEEMIPSEQSRIKKNHWTAAMAPSYPEPNPVMWDAYHEILDLCQVKGWNSILVTPPYPVEYNACFPDGVYESFLMLAAKLSEEYGVPYLDYSHDPAFSTRHDLFKNIDHLNLDGAAIFDQRFFADVRALELLT